MLTPRFKLSQDENHVFITVHAPYTNVGDTEIDVDGENFLFVSAPYFLRLRLSSKIVENEQSKGSYICDSGDFRLSFDKVTPGEHFENLDMITSLLAPREIPNMNPDLVEMLEEDGITVDEVQSSNNDANKYSYGFASKITHKFQDIGSEFPHIFELRIPEQVSIEERSIMQKKAEDKKFSSDHYLADYFDEELMEPYLNGVIFWNKEDYNKEDDFTDDEVTTLKEIPNKHYLLTKKEYKEVLLGLVDILFGYCYDKRTTMNDCTVESGWTINKLSSTLCWFAVFNDIKDVLVTCYRRALIYPIFRNFDLCNKVKEDVVSLLRRGKKFTIKCLIEIHQMFNANNDPRYILNQLYIKDYLVFLQKCRNEELDELYKNITNIDIQKRDLDLELEEFEYAAELVQQEEVDVMENEVALKMASMSLLPDLKRGNGQYISDSDDSDTSSDSSSDDSSSEDSSSELDSDDGIDDHEAS